MKLLKHSSRRQSFKKRKTALPTMSRVHSAMHPVSPKAPFYPLLRQRPAALIRNGIIGSGDGPGNKGLYQVDDRVYTTSKIFIRDGYMYPRQSGQTMDPRFPYELHEFPNGTGATGLQLVTTPKVHISGEYLACTGGSESHANGSGSLSRRDGRKAAAAEINLANQVYWLQKHRIRSRNNSGSGATPASASSSAIPKAISQDNEILQTNSLERHYIRNVDDLLTSMRDKQKQQQFDEKEQRDITIENICCTPQSTASHRLKKKVSFQTSYLC